MREAHVLGQIVVGTEPQPRDDVEIRIARRKKEDRHRRRQRAQLAAQREAAVDVVGKPDVDQREIGKPRPKRCQRVGAVRVRGDVVALLAQRIGVVGADRRLVLDDGNAA